MTDVGTAVPPSWALAPFGDMFDNVTHSTKKLPRGSYRSHGPYPVIDQGEQAIGGYTDDATLVHPGPIPAIVFGDHTRCVKYCHSRFVQGADGVKVLAPRSPLFPKYCYWVLRSAEVPSRGYARHFGVLRKLDFPLSPLPEQRRIVETIESYFTRLDSAVPTLERVQRNLKRYRASVLKAAVEGRLVPTEAELARAEGRDYEPASDLLRRILVERRRRWEGSSRKGKYREPFAPDTTALPDLPEGWCWASVDQLASKVVDGVHKKPSYVATGIPFVTVRNLTAGPGISLERLQHITRDDHEQFIRRANPERGDILISKDGTLGVTRAVRSDLEFSIFVSVALVKPVERSMTDYLELALSSPPVQAQMVPKGSGLQHIHLEDLRQDAVPIPPLAEQRRIAMITERHLSIGANLQETSRVAVRRLASIRQSILKWAFEGKLVDQDPNDEPASVLLERIRAERAVKIPATNGRRPRGGRARKAL